MGIKSNYFRHSFDAHKDTKLRKLVERCGAKAYAVYFVLLEVYCEARRSDDAQQIEQEIDLKLIASSLGMRSDSVLSCIIVMGELKLSEALSFNYGSTMIKLSIPKSLKYYGSYQKVSDENFPNKRKEKEKKEKEKKELDISYETVADPALHKKEDTLDQGKPRFSFPLEFDKKPNKPNQNGMRKIGEGFF